MNEALRIIQKRYSVRKFTDAPVAEKDLTLILEAGRLAPSASNQQPWHFMVIRNKTLLEQMVEKVNNAVDIIVSNVENEQSASSLKNQSEYYTFFKNAPLVVAVVKTWYNSSLERMKVSGKIQKELGIIDDCGNRIEAADIQSVAASIQNMLLAATSLGYGTCWMTGPLIARIELEKLLGIEDLRKAALEKSPENKKPLKPEKPWELMALIPIGRPAGGIKDKIKSGLGGITAKLKNRKSLDEITTFLN